MRAWFQRDMEKLASVRAILKANGLSDNRTEYRLCTTIPAFVLPGWNEERCRRRSPSGVSVRAVYVSFGNQVDSKQDAPCSTKKAGRKRLVEIRWGNYYDPQRFDQFYTCRLKVEGTRKLTSTVFVSYLTATVVRATLKTPTGSSK